MREFMNSMALDGIELCPFRLIGHGFRERIGVGHADRFILIEHKDTVRLQCCSSAIIFALPAAISAGVGAAGFSPGAGALRGAAG